MTGTITLLISEPFSALSSNTSTNRRSSWKAAVPIAACDLVLAVLAGAAAGVDRAGALVMAVMHAPVERCLKALADAGKEHRIADEVERFWLLDRDGHGWSAPSLPPAA